MSAGVEMVEDLGDGFFVATSKDHKFGTDAFLLSKFASNIKHKDVVADFGAGCGILSLLVYKLYTPQKIYAFDILDSCVLLTKKSVLNSNLQEKIIVHKQDIKKLDSKVYGKFDRIICNPPYKALGTGVISVKEQDKIIRHETAVNVEDICLAASRLLKFKGSIYLCGRAERLSDVIITMSKYFITPKRLQFCAKDVYSAPWLFLLEGRYRSGSFLNVMPTAVLNA